MAAGIIITIAATFASSAGPAEAAGATMSIHVYKDTTKTPASQVCGAGVVGRTCNVPAGLEFSLDVFADNIPADGYFAYQVVVQYSSLLTLVNQPGRSENLWPDGDCVPTGSSETKAPPRYTIACKTEVRSFYQGRLVNLHFMCDKRGGSAQIDLIGGAGNDVSFYFRPNISGSFVYLKSVAKGPKVVADSVHVNCDIDPDGDGCPTYREILPKGQSNIGGGRDPFNYWDIFNTPKPNTTPARNNVVDIDDVIQVAARFAAVGDPSQDPLSPPPKTGYHPAYDRGLEVGPNFWNLAPADGAIDIDDVFHVVAQFGTFCKYQGGSPP